MPMTK